MASSSSSVKYPYPVGVQVENFVYVKLTSQNYSIWKPMMDNLLETHGLNGFIDGSIPSPPKKIGDTENPDYLEWIKSDDLVRTWILSTVDESKYLEDVNPLQTAKELWTTMQRSVSDLSSIFEESSSDNTIVNSTATSPLHHPSEPPPPTYSESVGITMSKVSTPIAKELWTTMQRSDSIFEVSSSDNTIVNSTATTPLHHPSEPLPPPYSESVGITMSRVSTPIEKDGRGVNLSRYIPFSTTILDSNWDKAETFFIKEPNACTAFITVDSETALMIAARSTGRVDIVRKLLTRMDPSSVVLQNYKGFTALHMAAGSGNRKAAELIVVKNPLSPYVLDMSLALPLHIAALFGERTTVLFLLNVTKKDRHRNPYEGESGVKLVHALVASELYDIALDLLKEHPNLSVQEPTALGALAIKRSAFKSGAHLNFYERFPKKLLKRTEAYSTITSVLQKVDAILWKIREITVPHLRSTQDRNMTNHHALELVKFLCSKIVKLDHSEASNILGEPVMRASSFGVYEVLEEILSVFPSALYLTDEMNRTLFHLSIVNRRVSIFNIIYQVEHKHMFLRAQDKGMNNCLHLAGLLESPQKVNLMEGETRSALPMQQELQWFKAVEALMLKQDKEQRNEEGKTPAMVFTESHEDLVRAGQQWMKEISNSCTIAAALIVTIVFAAAITVPGGNNGDIGYPYFRTHMAFKVFAVSDALALFSSTSSMLMFLSIYTSRFRQQDFLYAIPKRLIIGLTTLFLSIIFMMIAFGATLQIMFGHGRPWIIGPIVALSSVPVMLFVFLQFPLLWDMIISTYGPGIFGKQSNRMFY